MTHTVALVGAELEENLSLRYLAAAVAVDGSAPSWYRSTRDPTATAS